MSLVELLSKKKTLEEKIEAEETKIKAQEDKELEKQRVIYTKNKETSKDFAYENWKYGTALPPFQRFLKLVSLYDVTQGKVKIPIKRVIVSGDVISQPEWLTVEQAIEKFNLVELSDMINKLCKPGKTLDTQKENYLDLKKKVTERRKQ